MENYDKTQLASLIHDYQNRLMQEYGNTSTPASSIKTTSQNIAVQTEAASPEVLVSSPDPNPMLTDVGNLQIRVSTENQAIPIPDATVTISHNANGNRYIDRVLITDQSGLTPIIELPTKDRALSLKPGSERPYAVYTVTVAADGYFSKEFIDLPIYGGVTAIQSVTMIPLPEAGGEDLPLSYTQSGPSL